MQNGEHYILFLRDDPRSYAPKHVGIPRYLIAGDGVAGQYESMAKQFT